MTPSKRFIHDPVALVDLACRGVQALHPGLIYDQEYRVLYKPINREKQPQVTLLSGGGSGHEPGHTGYVGDGMLTAAVCGAIFASPNIIQIEKALSSIQSPRGTLVIVKNYTGDKLNFGLGVEKHRASSFAKTNMILVADDVSIGRTRSRMVGRRGLAGTALVHKVAGAAAAACLPLEQITYLAEYVNRNLATIGVGLDYCDVPGQQYHGSVAPDEVELGLGIHNEPGSKRLKPQPDAIELIEQMLKTILDPTDVERNYLGRSPDKKDQSDYVLLVNNLGGLSVLELTALTGIVAEQLSSQYSIKPRRAYSGTFMSALNGSGFSITLLHLPNDGPSQKELRDQVMSYLDAPTSAIGWTAAVPLESLQSEAVSIAREQSSNSPTPLDELPCDSELTTSILLSVQSQIIRSEPQITSFDTLMGDGDCGTTLVTGISTIISALAEIQTGSLTHTTMKIAEIISNAMGGTSGALYAIFFTAFANAARGLKLQTSVNFTHVVSMASEALEILQGYTAAQVGDRTMMDALIPFIEILSKEVGAGSDTQTALERALEATREGAKATRSMQSMFGRSAYVGVEEETESETKGLPDPGALGVVAIVEGILTATRSKGRTLADSPMDRPAPLSLGSRE